MCSFGDTCTQSNGSPSLKGGSSTSSIAELFDGLPSSVGSLRERYAARNPGNTTVLPEARNVAVVASIHQPSSRLFLVFQNLLLLQKSGVAYRGPTETAGDAFAESPFDLPCPPAFSAPDWLMEIVVRGDLRAAGPLREGLHGRPPRAAGAAGDVTGGAKETLARAPVAGRGPAPALEIASVVAPLA